MRYRNSSRRQTVRARGIAGAAVAISSLCVLHAAPEARGITGNWTNAAGGNYNTGANWNTNPTVPSAAADVAQFNIANTYSVTLDISPSITAVNVGGSNVTFLNSTAGRTFALSGALTVNSGSLTLNAAQPIAFSAAGGATLNATTNISAGSDLTVTGGSLGIGTSTTATTTIDGAGSTLSVTGGTNFGNLAGGSGTLILQNGALGSLGLLNISSSPVGNDGSLIVQSGADVTASGVSLGSGGGAGQVGTLTVDGAGSTMSQSASFNLNVGAAANSSATMTISNLAAYTVSTGATNVHSTGRLDVLSGGTFSTGGNVNITPSSGSGTEGVIRVSGSGSSFTQTGSSTLNVGNATAGAATLQIDTGGTFTTGTGLTTVNPTGLIDIQDGGTFNANGNITIAQGGIQRSSLGTFNWAAGKTMAVQNDSSMIFQGDYSLPNSAVVNVNGSGASFGASSAGSITVGSSSQVNLTGTGELVTDTNINIGTSGNGTVNLSDSFTSYGAPVVNVGGNGATGTLTLSTGSVGFQNDLNVATSGGAGTVGNVTIQSDADVLAFQSVAIGGPATTGTVTVTGAGSTLVLDGTAALNVGSTTANSGTLNVTSSGAVTTNTGATTVNSGGLLNINGGAFNAGEHVTVNGGSLTLSGGGVLNLTPGKNLIAQSNGQVSLTGSVNIPDTSSFVIQTGADLSITGALDVGNAGSATVTVTGIGSTINQTSPASVVLGNATVGTTTVNVNNSASFSQPAGGSTDLNPTATLNINAGTVSLGTLNANGGVINLNSGLLSFVGNLTIGTGGPLGTGLTLDASKALTLTGTTTIDAFRTLTLSGGTLNTGHLVKNGTFNFTSGTLGITGAGGLTVGTGGALGATVIVNTGQALNVTNTTTVASSGTLVVADGQANLSGGVANNGEIRLSGIAPHLIGGAITNNQLIRGDGRIDNPVTNASSGEIRVESGKTLLFTGASGTNSGDINLQGGINQQAGTLQFSQTLTNGPAGRITGRGALYFDGGLTNDGEVQLSAGFTDVHGNIIGNSGSLIIVTGGSTSTFYDDVDMNTGSEFRVSDGSAAVFFGNVTGTSFFTGAGIKYFEDGNSAMEQLATGDGDTVVQASATLSANRIVENSLTVNGLAVVPAVAPAGFDPGNNVYPGGSNANGSLVKSLAVNGAGQLDLGNSDLVIDHDGASPLVDVRAMLASGYNFGGQDGPGIISTTAALTDPFTFALGYAENADLPLPYGSALGGGLFSSQDPDATAVLIKFTWVGDVTLDGVFDFQDLSIFNGNYDAGATTGRVWTDGDLNYDGTIDFQDLSLFNGNYDPSKPSLPEPTSLVLLGAFAAGLGARRRR